MISTVITEVKPISPVKMQISWRFVQSMDDFQDYIFTLERSESPEQGYSPVFTFNHNITFLDELSYKKIWRSLYYRIKSEHAHTHAIEYSAPSPVSASPDLQAIEIVRRNDIMLKNMRYGVGVPMAIFKLKTIGPACECWDANKQRPRISSCTDCFGSHIDGGYYPPIITWANPSPPQKVIQLPQWGEMEPNEARMFFNNYPELCPKDLIFSPHNMMFYTVEKVETSTRREYILHQIVSASGHDRGHVAYNLLTKYPKIVDDLYTERSKIKNS